MSQNDQHFRIFCDLLVKIAPDLKKKIGFRFEKFQKMGVIWRQNFKFSEKLGLWVTAYNFCLKYGVFG